MSRTRRHIEQAKFKKRLYAFDMHRYDPMGTWPAWHDDIFHTRPARRKEHALLKECEAGLEPTEWPDHRKPHKYYW